MTSGREQEGMRCLSKHHRFADMPLHNHDFIEMNYMYSGKCRQMIDGEEIGLEQGQICIIDTHVPHSIYALAKMIFWSI